MSRLLLLTLLLGCGSPGDSGKESGGSDQDGDGYPDSTDCEPENDQVNPGAAEVCDGVDNDCNGTVDNGVLSTFYADADGDGYGEDASTTADCSLPSGYATAGGDCDDTDGAVNPGASEACNEVDDNCDGTVDEGVLTTFYADNDGDGFGNDAYTADACVAGVGYASQGGDCDDGDDTSYPGAPEPDCTDPVDHNCDGSVGYDDLDEDGYAACDDCDDRAEDVNPGAIEMCDALDVDEDCDGNADDADPDAVGKSEAWTDADHDGFGDPSGAMYVCDVPATATTNDNDCDDATATTNPGAAETCNDVDDDCDGAVDDGVLLTVYVDEDGDGYGLDAYSMEACEVPPGYAAMGGDCDDTDPDYHPDALEDDCTDPADYNCDGTVGYSDADGDGWAACVDCDDADAAVNPGEVEICGGGDEDCNGAIDDDDPGVSDQVTVYSDGDGDGYGVSSSAMLACVVGDGWSTMGGDCDDAVSTTWPGAGEACDNVDNDCDGTIDDGASDATTWYFDFDGDGHGGSTLTYVGCEPPADYVIAGDDCDDGDDTAYPGNAETCDAVDNDCDGSVDDGVAPTWYLDNDGDGFGLTASVSHDCTRPAGYVPDPDDCNDGSAAAYPGATEICDLVDNDCDRLVDDGDPDTDTSTGTLWHPDVDGDGYGDTATSQLHCKAPVAWIADGTDCNDHTVAIHPGLTDMCNDTDNDCDGETDEDGWTDVYEDNDSDGDGDRRGETVVACDDDTHSTTNTDCDDTDPAVQACAFYPFDGTTGTSWESIALPATSSFGCFSNYVPLDSPYQMYSFYGSKVYGYDAATNSWHTFSTTNPLSSAYYGSLAPSGGTFWSIRNSTVRSFDPVTDAFTTKASVSMYDYYPMTESDENGIIYGFNYSGSSIIAYDTATNTSSSLSTGKSAYYTRMAYDPDSRSILFGSYSQYNFYKYNLDTGTTTTTTSMTELLGMAVCSDRAGHIYVGGYSGSDLTVYQYTVATDTWARIPDTPTSIGLTGSCGVSEDGYLYMTSGSSTIYRLALY